MLSTCMVLAACAVEAVPSEEVAVARAALSESISPFPAAGDFEESSDLNNWTGTCAQSSSQAHAGSYSLRCGGGQSHTMTLDATGYTGIAITYWRYGSSLESGETFTLEWSTDGSNWTVLETVSDASWVSKSYTLPSGADNASALRLRFRTSASSSSLDAAYLDDLDINGTSSGGAVCGDAVCGSTEDCSSCSADCGACPAVCGDAVCDSTEDCSSCSADCGSCSVCGDAVCGAGEDCTNCSGDCGSCSGTDDPQVPGPYGACYYETDMTRAQYEGERMYYPCAPGSEPSGPISGGVYGASTLSPGYTNSSSVIFWLAEHAASHGFVVLAMEPTNKWGNNPDWRDAHIAAYHELIEENGRAGGPVQSSVDTSKIQIMGFSKGGGGTLMAAQQLTSEGKVLGAVQPLAPYYDSWSDVNLITAPVAIHVGADDTTAKPSEHSIPMFNGLNANTTRLLAIYTGFGHDEWYKGSGTHRYKIKQYVTSWMKLHLDGNTAYYSFINGADHQPGWFTQYDLIEP